MTYSILSNSIASISELKKHPMQVVKSASGEPIAILNRNEPVFYCVPPKLFEAMLEHLDDLSLVKLAKSRANEKQIEVDMEE